MFQFTKSIFCFALLWFCIYFVHAGGPSARAWWWGRMDTAASHTYVLPCMHDVCARDGSDRSQQSINSIQIDRSAHFHPHPLLQPIHSTPSIHAALHDGAPDAFRRDEVSDEAVAAGAIALQPGPKALAGQLDQGLAL